MSWPSTRHLTVTVLIGVTHPVPYINADVAFLCLGHQNRNRRRCPWRFALLVRGPSPIERSRNAQDERQTKPGEPTPPAFAAARYRRVVG